MQRIWRGVWPAVLMLAVAMTGFVQAATVSLSAAVYQSGQTIAVRFTGGTGSTRDWFGIYPRGVTPGAVPSTDWKYLNNSRSAAGTGNGLVTFSSDQLVAGAYSLWFLANDGYQPIHPAVDFNVSAAAQSASLQLDNTNVGSAEALQVSFNNPQPSARDWLAVYPAGSVPARGSVDWQYLNGSKTPTTAQAAGKVSFAARLTPAAYDLWLLADDGYQPKAGPLRFTVKDSKLISWLAPEFALYRAVIGQDYQLRLSAYLNKNSQPLRFQLLSAPEWLSLSADGLLTGRPSQADAGQARLVVQATDLSSQHQVVADIRLAVMTPLQNEQQPIQVMTFNVWHAFAQVKDGYQKGLQAIVSSGADLVGLQEANQALAARLAADLGWYHAVGAHQGIQIISRYPVSNFYNLDFSLLAEVQLPYLATPLLRFVNTHLDYQYYGPYAAEAVAATEQSVLAEELRSARLSQSRQLLTLAQPLLAQSAQVPVVLTGDFNTPSHLDWTAQTRRYGLSSVAWPVSTALLAAGFQDTFRVSHPDPVSEPGNTWSPVFRGSEPQDRIDHIYLHGPVLQVTAARTFTTQVEQTTGRWGSNPAVLADNSWPSDHAAVLTALRPTLHPADLDQNRQIDQRDVDLLRQRIQQGAQHVLLDFNADGKVDPQDVRAMMALCSRPRCAS